MSRLYGLTVVLWLCPCCLANWLSVLASQKRSGRGSCSGSQCPQGPLSWPLCAGHNGCRVCALVSLCVCLCNCSHDCQSICLCDRETKMLVESSLWKINLGSFPCYFPGTLVLRNYDTAIVASLFCFLQDDLYPGVRNARLLKSSVCDLTSWKWESGWEGRRTWKTVNSLFGLWNETVKSPDTGLRLSGYKSRSATFSNSVPWAKSFYSVPKFVHLQDRDSNSAQLIGLWRLNIRKTLRTVPDT